MSILVSHKTSLFRTKESPLTISYPLEKSTVPNQTKVDNLVLAAGGHADYSCNLALSPFLWSACRVHLMSSLPLALGQAFPISVDLTSGSVGVGQNISVVSWSVHFF